MLLLYVGPDQLMPLASAFAAIGGAIMIFWRQVTSLAKRIAGVFRRSDSPKA
jgi:hypothetical protein